MSNAFQTPLVPLAPAGAPAPMDFLRHSSINNDAYRPAPPIEWKCGYCGFLARNMKCTSCGAPKR